MISPKTPRSSRSPSPGNSDNLHRIAISNITVNEERKIFRWWAQKYGVPQKPLMEHTTEELLIQMLEDFYEKNPAEMEKFLTKAKPDDDWDGATTPEYEAAMEKRLKKIQERNRVDLKRYQDDKPLSKEEEEKVLKNLGLPTDDEFEDVF